MTSQNVFRPAEIDKIVSRFGRPFYEKALKDMDHYADRWNLTSFQLIPSFSANLVLTCESARFGSAVLKIGKSASKEFISEWNALREYDGRRFCRVFDADPDNGVILEERVRPGTPLRDERSLERRLSVFCSMYKDLHIPPADPAMYPTYTGWVARITDYMSRRHDCKELYAYMKKANDLCQSVAAAHTQQMLLHGDFHHDNILLGEGGAYTIIDPKGVVGDPVFDVPRFILNEFDDEQPSELAKKINEIIGILEKNLLIPNDLLRKCLFVETAMGECWSVEDGATPEEYPKLLQTVEFAEALLSA